MTIYTDRGRKWHVIDRLPSTQDELDYVAKMFPGGTLKRKTNSKAIYLRETKIKNIHWYN